MSFLFRKFPGRHAVLLLTVAVIIGTVGALDRLVMGEFPYIDLMWLLPVVFAAVFLSPLETVAVGLAASIFDLASLTGVNEHARIPASILVGASGILAAVTASLVRRHEHRLIEIREAVESSPLAYAEFKFPGYILTSHNNAFANLSRLAAGTGEKNALDNCFPVDTASGLARKMDETVAARCRCECADFQIPLLDGKDTFWCINMVPITSAGGGTPKAVALFASEVTDAVARSRMREAALRISAQAMSSLSLGDTVSGVMDGLAHIADTNAGALFLLEDDQWVGKTVFGGYGKDAIRRMRFPYEDFSGAMMAIEGREVLSADDAAFDSRLNQSIVKNFGIKSCMIVPLITANRNVGAVYLAHTGKKRKFTEEQIKFATIIGSHAALAIENALIYENERTMRNSLEAIEVVSEAGLVSLDLEEVLGELVARTQEVMQMDVAIILLYDENRDCLVGRAAAGGACGSPASLINRQIGDGIAGRAFEEGTPLKIDNISGHEEEMCPLDACRNQECPFCGENGILSVLAVPLRAAGKIMGVLQIGSRRKAAFSAQDWGLIQVLADRASLAVQNSMLHEETKRELARVELLREVASACAGNHDLRAIAGQALQAVYRQLGCQIASIYYFDKKQDALLNLAFLGHPEEIAQELKITPIERGTLLTRAVKERRIITHEEINLDNATEPEARVLRLLDVGYNRRVTLPLIYKDEVVGGMALAFPDTRPFSQAGLETIKGIANQLAVVFKNRLALQEEELEAVEIDEFPLP